MKSANKYFKKRKHSIRFLLATERNLYTPEVYHQLRIEIKKLDALVQLVNSCAHKFKKHKVFKPFKAIFQQAGKVRDFQVQEERLKQYFSTGLPLHYSYFLKHQINTNKIAYFNVLKKYNEKKLKKSFKIIKHYLSEVEKEESNKYLHEKIKDVKKLFQGDFLTEDNMHSLRKQLKTITYTSKLLNQDIDAKLLEYNHSYSELLGKWHDCQVILNYLTNAIKYFGINQNDKIEMNNIILKIVSDKDKLYTILRTSKL